MILILGSNEEAHAKYIFDKLKAKNIDVEYIDTRQYPESLFLSYSPNNILEGSFIKINNKKVYVKDIKGVYWRWSYGIKYQNISNTDQNANMIVQKECKSALDSLFHITKNTCNWLNPITAIEMHKNKAYQLSLMSKNNIRTPKTLITNDFESMREFYETNNKNVIYKPVAGGAYTKKLAEEDFLPERKEQLKYCPITLQECIDGEDVRVYAFKNKFFAGIIKANSLDFREDKNAEIIRIKLPKEVKSDCKKVLKLFDLNYSGIDIRKTKDDEFVFIEANPAPMFGYFEKVTGYPISDTLVEKLTQ